MLSTIGVHQPQQTPGIRSTINSTNYNPHQQQYNTIALNGIPQPDRRLLNLQYLDLTDCTSLEDSGLKMIVECCPQLLYLFMRRCSTLTGKLLVVNNIPQYVYSNKIPNSSCGEPNNSIDLQTSLH